jgi:quinol monooxygenase YgiN
MVFGPVSTLNHQEDSDVCSNDSGNNEAIALSSDTDRDQFVGVTLWKSKEDADKYINGQGKQMLESIKPLLQQEPTFRTFNLEASTIHNIGIGRAASSS